MVEREESPTLYQKRFFLPAVVRMTVFRNFFPAAKKLPRKVARWLSGTPASRFARRRGLRNSLRSNSPRPISVFSLAPGSPIKAGIFPLRHYRPLRVKAATHLSFRMNMRNPMLFVWDSSFHCVPFRMTFDCHSERGYQPMRNPSLRSWVEILPPCGRQNDSALGMRFFTPLTLRSE